MPRKSAEDRAATLYRSGATPPRPPKNLGRSAADHWQIVVNSRPADYFDGATVGMLGIYCSALAATERLTKAMADIPVGTPQSGLLTKDFAALSGLAISLARQLRLTKQAVSRAESGEHTERGTSPDPLLGGAVVGFPRT